MTERRLTLTPAQMGEAIRNMRSFAEGVSFEDCKKDAKTRHAIERCVEIISEAARRLPPSVLEKHSEISWQGIKGIGNVLRHRYDDVDIDIIWDVLDRHLEPLERAIADIAVEHGIELPPG